MNLDAVKFHMGAIVYRKVDPEEKGIVTGILFRPTGVLYSVTWADVDEKTHYDIELTAEPSFAK